MTITAEPVPILEDNYAWLLRDSRSGAVAIVDPADPDPIIKAIEQRAGGRLDRQVREGDTIRVGDAEGRVIDTPGHTRGQINIFFADGAVLLSGDTLFSLGCGRLIEGTAEEMFGSLRKLAALPPETLVCCGHEYTESNGRFALTVEPDNAALKARMEEVRRLRQTGKPSLPSRLGDELAANPFLRAPDAASFARIRTAKDNFR